VWYEKKRDARNEKRKLCRIETQKGQVNYRQIERRYAATRERKKKAGVGHRHNEQRGKPGSDCLNSLNGARRWGGKKEDFTQSSKVRGTSTIGYRLQDQGSSRRTNCFTVSIRVHGMSNKVEWYTKRKPGQLSSGKTGRGHTGCAKNRKREKKKKA